MCPFVPNLLEIGTNEVFDEFNLDAILFPAEFWASQTLDGKNNAKQSDSIQSTSSAENVGVAIALIDKKTSHNASERDRRKKINVLYSSLRALLPDNTDHKKKLSIPVTVARVIKYIPELQKEVKDLNHRKEELLLETSMSQSNERQFITIQEDQKPIIRGINKERISPFSVSINKLSDKEMMIQISAIERISFSEVLLVIEESGYNVIDVCSLQSFGGRTFYYIHLWIEGINNAMNLEKLNEELRAKLVSTAKKRCKSSRSLEELKQSLALPMIVPYIFEL